MTLIVDDGDGGQARAFVTISVTDVDEPPQRPGAPAVTAVSGITTSLQASWSAPANAGRPPITSYNMQYRKQRAANWTDGPQDVAGTSTQIDGLDAGTVYEVQVRASNDEGDGPYSPPGTASTGTGAGDNDAPVFVSSMVTLTLPENTGGGVDVGSPVEATDADGDSLTYSLGGADASSFTIDETSSQIRTREGVTYDYESKSSYSVTVTVREGNGGVTGAAVTVELIDVVPARPSAPTVVTVSQTSVRVVWTLPEGGDGTTGAGKVVYEGTNDSGLFYFFEPGDNWEVLIKVLNGCGLNDRVWVYGASATTLGYSIRVTDTETGEVRNYRKDPGEPAAAISDMGAFTQGCSQR